MTTTPLGKVKCMRAYVAAVAALVVLGAAGCSGDDPEPNIADPVETTSPVESTTSPEPTDEGTPEPWEEKSKAGAIAFVRHWLELFNEAETTGSTEMLADVSMSECETCTNFIHLIDSTYERGGAIRSDGWRVTKYSFSPSFDADGRISLTIKQSRQTWRRGAQTQVDRYPGGVVRYSASVHWSGNWNLARMDLVK